ncbi:MAG: site-2 protease family protein, partial [Gemmataceae bacterium]
VLQRMFIISAGVIMNVLFGLICFVAVYRYHGVDRPPATVWWTDAGSPSWEKGVRAGWRVTRIGDHKDPFFDDLKYAVGNSFQRAVLAFEFTDRDGKTFERDLEPSNDANASMPTIGVTFPYRLKLLPEAVRRLRSVPVNYHTAAAAARAVALERGDAVLKADGTPEPWAEVCRRLADAGGEAVELTVRRAGGKTEQLSVPAKGFDFDDTIVGTTDPRTPDDPFNVDPIPPDPNQEPKRGLGDPFEYRRRLFALAGKPMVFEVSRGKDRRRVRVLVPPAYHRDLGLRMKMGKVAAVRFGSGAEQAKLARGDEISQVGLKFGDGPVDWETLKGFDPVRLPDALYAAVHRAPKERPAADHSVVFKVRVTIDHDKRGEKELPPIRWDDTWGPGDEAPIGPSSPMSIPQVGVAYQVDSTVVEVRPGSPAEKAGLKPNDQVVQLRVREGGKTPDAEKWSKWLKLASKRDKDAEVHDQWAHYFWVLQQNDHAAVELKVKRGGEPLAEAFGPMNAAPDVTWPLAERGLPLTMDMRRQKAESFGEAMWLGVERSAVYVKNILLSLYNLATRRVSANNLGGPIEIATQAFSVANEDWFLFAQWLGIISINLAVVNFLPIPVLDGGHMVFLLYEWVRGKPPAESVKNTATIVGLVLILGLMAFVLYGDIVRRIL